jgi:hypothetical protein
MATNPEASQIWKSAGDEQNAVIDVKFPLIVRAVNLIDYGGTDVLTILSRLRPSAKSSVDIRSPTCEHMPYPSQLYGKGHFSVLVSI